MNFKYMVRYIGLVGLTVVCLGGIQYVLFNIFPHWPWPGLTKYIYTGHFIVAIISTAIISKGNQGEGEFSVSASYINVIFRLVVLTGGAIIIIYTDRDGYVANLVLFFALYLALTIFDIVIRLQKG